MKLIFIALFSFSSVLAQGAEIICQDQNGGPDHGFSIRFSKNLTAALVESQSIAGPRIVAELVCQRPHNHGPARPDQIISLAHCSEPELRDAGYTVVLQTGGLVGTLRAFLSEVTFAGSDPVATLRCRERN